MDEAQAVDAARNWNGNYLGFVVFALKKKKKAGSHLLDQRVEVGQSLGGAGRVVAASEFPRVPTGLPQPAASRPVAPSPFQRLPPAARRSSGDEFRHLFRDDPDYDA